MTLVAAVDESYRTGRYLMGVAWVGHEVAGATRASLRRLLMPGQRELHIKGENDARRRLLIDRVASSPAELRVYVASCGRREQERVREMCLARIVEDLVEVGGRRLILDTRDGRDRKDALTIRRVNAELALGRRVEWAHVESAQEPLVWLADVVGWAFGAGGDWRRRLGGSVSCIEVS